MDGLTRQLQAAINAGDTEEIDRLVELINKEDDARQSKLNVTGALKAAAEWYIRQGVPVFPCAKKGKVPLTQNGFKAATTDSEQIRRWWSRNPYANIGTPTGLTFDVIDIDGPAGYTAFAEMQAEGLVPPILGRAITPSGGMHILVPPSGEGNTTQALDEVDYRGAGGYILLAPSYVVEEKKGYSGRYTWTTRPNFRKLGKK